MKAASKGWIQAVTGLALAGASAVVAAAPTITATGISFGGASFYVKPQAVGEPYQRFIAGSLNFDVASEVDQFNGRGTPFTPSGTSDFNETGVAQISSFRQGVGRPGVGSGVSGLENNSGPGDTTGYSFYALFSGSGMSQFVSTSQGPRILGTFDTFNVSFYVDRNNDTTFDNTGPDDRGFAYRATGDTTDDVLVLTGRLLEGNFSSGTSAPNFGSFGVFFRVTGFGATDFFSTDVSGQPLNGGQFSGNNTFVQGLDLPPAAFVDGLIEGSGNTTLGNAVPEPASLALVGLALVGAGVARRRTRG